MAERKWRYALHAKQIAATREYLSRRAGDALTRKAM
jgi:hypothetical protein